MVLVIGEENYSGIKIAESFGPKKPCINICFRTALRLKNEHADKHRDEHDRPVLHNALCICIYGKH